MPQAVAYVAANVANWVSAAVYTGLTAVGVSGYTAAVAASYAAAAATAAVYVTAYLGPSLLTPRPSQPGSESAKEPINQTRPPRRLGAGGSARLGGPRFLFASVKGFGVEVIGHVEGPVAGFSRTWLNDDEVTPDGTTGVVAALADGSYGGGAVTVKSRVGAATETAHPEVIAAVTAGGLPDLWTSAHRCDGIATSALVLKKVGDDDLMKVYRLGRPKLSRLVTFAFYDWRKDSTQPGGSGAHRVDDPTTWETSANPIVCMAHTEVQRFGQSWTRRFAPVLAELTAEADYCDALVPTKGGGTRPRYEVHGSFVTTDDRAAVRRWYLECMDGSFWRRGDGAIIIRAGRHVAPTFSLNARHILSITWRRGIQKARRANQLTGAFCSPEHNWTDQQADPFRDEASIAEVGVVASTFDRSWVAHHEQWRALAKREWLRRQVKASGTITTTLFGLNWQGERFITLPPVPGVPASLAGGLELEVVGVRKRWPLQVVFEVIESVGAAIDDFDPDVDGGTGPAAVDAVARVPVAAPTFDAGDVEVSFAGDAAVITVVLDSYVGGFEGNRFGLRWRVDVPGQPADAGWSPATSVLASDGATEVVLQSGLLAADQDYEVQAMAMIGGVGSPWSASVAIAVGTDEIIYDGNGA